MTLGRLKGKETGLQEDTCTLMFIALHTHTHTHTQCAVLFSQEKEGNSATCGNMDGTWENIMPSEIRQNKKTTTV